MASWKQWKKMALESQRVALAARDANCPRSSASRYYYAAYQAMTAVLHYAGENPPEVEGEQRESWNHAVTPDMVFNNFRRFIENQDRRKDLRSRLRELYKVRVYADYVGSQALSERSLKKVQTDANYLVKVALDILPAEAEEGE